MNETKQSTQLTLGGGVDTRVVNQKTSKYSVDIGRSNNGDSHMNNTEIGDPGWLGNPYPESVHGRDKCIELFRVDFINRLQNDKEFNKAVERLEGETLGCHCKPKPCLGDVIKEFIENEL